jgi:serine/threonine-protein kinase
MTLAAGERLGPYEILELLGRGGMGVVYKAFDPALNRTVALKVLPSEFLDDASFGDRFQREVRIWASLDHPSVVPVYMAGIEGGRPFFAMKYVAGGTLADRLKQRPPSVERAFALLADVAVALDYAHSRGIVHRDVKPANVLLEEDGRAYLSDFGIARIVSGERAATATQPGGVVGTPRYMAPEQARSLNSDHRADIYSLGCMAYEMLTGSAPFRGETPLEVMMRHITEPPTPPRALAPALPAATELAILRAIDKDPRQRWPTATLFVQALTGAIDPQGSQTVSLPGYRLPVAESSGGTKRPATQGRTRLLAALVAGLALGICVLGGMQWYAARAARAAAAPVPTPPAALAAAAAEALDKGAYREALDLVDLTLRLYPEHAPSRELRERARKAWDAELKLGLWPDPSPVPGGGG